MARIMSKAMCAAAWVAVAWVALSWAEILCKNVGPDPVYSPLNVINWAIQSAAGM